MFYWSCLFAPCSQKSRNNDSTTFRRLNKVHISENYPSREKYENETVFVQSALYQQKSFLSLQSID